MVSKITYKDETWYPDPEPYECAGTAGWVQTGHAWCVAFCTMGPYGPRRLVSGSCVDDSRSAGKLAEVLNAYWVYGDTASVPQGGLFTEAWMIPIIQHEAWRLRLGPGGEK